MYTKLITKDLKHIWHPCSFMQDFEQYPPLVVHSAKGSYINTNQGTLIDAISSWWCKSLGHGHPAIIAAIKTQLDKFEHVITANTTNPLVVELAEKLSEISGKQHVFFASDGACAVEISLKLAIHAAKLKGFNHKTKFISLKNSYHGETFATMAISDSGIFKKTYDNLQTKNYHIENIPYLSNNQDPLWKNCDTMWQSILPKLEGIKNDVAAIIFEPIIQGAAGMLCYSPDLLRKLAKFAKENDIYIIADEIMTGLGRTGKWLAQNHAGIEADFTCLSKGLTSGSIPMSAVMIDDNIYSLFYQDYNPENAFLHSHTFGGNPLAVSAALATIKVMQQENINEQAVKLGDYMYARFKEVANNTGKLTNIRNIGAIVAADINNPENLRIGYQIAQSARKFGALLRPIGNCLYWLPPLNTDFSTIDKLAEITNQAIEDAWHNTHRKDTICTA